MPHLLEGFQYTPGWGSVGAITVSILAIVVSSIFNFRTLKRSAHTLELAEQTSARTEERYQADRIEARKEKLINALADVSHTIAVWTVVNQEYAHLLDRYGVHIGGSSMEVLDVALKAVADQDREKQHPAVANAQRALLVAELLSQDQYAPISDQLHQISVLLLEVQHAGSSAELAGASTKLERRQERITDGLSNVLSLRQDIADCTGRLINLASDVLSPKG